MEMVRNGTGQFSKDFQITSKAGRRLSGYQGGQHDAYAN